MKRDLVFHFKIGNSYTKVSGKQTWLLVMGPFSPSVCILSCLHGAAEAAVSYPSSDFEFQH